MLYGRRRFLGIPFDFLHGGGHLKGLFCETLSLRTSSGMHASRLKRATLVMVQSFRSEHTHICERQIYLYFQLSFDLPLCIDKHRLISVILSGAGLVQFFSLHAVLRNHRDPGTLDRLC